MDLDPLTESLPIRKISNSTMQFRQLIQSLRTRRQLGEDTLGSRLQPEQKDQDSKESKEDTTVFESQQKTSSQSNNFMMGNQSESRLKSKAKCEVGDRDKLRKKQFALNNNPEVEPPVVKESSCSHLEVSIQVEESVAKVKIPLRTSPQKNASTQFDGFQPSSSSQLTSHRDHNKTGQIIKQIVNAEESHNPQPSSSPSPKIRDIPERTVLGYIEKEIKMTEKSDPSEIFTFFTNLCLSCGVVIRSPSIKKYKNCIYFGHTISKESSYQGFLYFYDQKIYFGQFLNGFKHGLGVELNIGQHSTAKGEFKDGHKTGKFYLQKPSEKFIGFLENGIYQGEGRLTTEDYVYEGLFEKGQKHGYGQEFYPKTGVKISGMFKNGVLSKQKGSKSIPQIRHKKRNGSEVEKERLAHIRRKSLDKHNQRMSKIRSQSKRQNEYEMEFDTTEDYHEPAQLQFNPSKLEMYRQAPQKLPKICQQLEYSFQNGRNFESISSRHETHRRPFPKSRSKREFVLGETSQRETTCQFQQPLPTPCLSVYPRRR